MRNVIAITAAITAATVLTIVGIIYALITGDIERPAATCTVAWVAAILVINEHI